MARFDVTSFELTEIAAAGSTKDAFLELGLLYRAGRHDVAINLVSAHKWFNLVPKPGAIAWKSHAKCRNARLRRLSVGRGSGWRGTEGRLPPSAAKALQ